jgi:hypothetical protein
MNDEEAFELIQRRRRQMHVHSVIYYHLNDSIISDYIFDEWAVELLKLQTKYPQFLHKGYMHTFFANWTGDTGMHLPVKDETLALAHILLEIAHRKNSDTGYIDINSM